jgi:hypothetical protein
LITLLRQQQTAIATLTQQATSSGQSLPPDRHSIPTHKPPEYYNNAKYEDIISKPIKLLYDGSSEQLIPFLNRLDIQRQDKGWYPITFLSIHGTRYDLIRHFATIDESVLLQEAKVRWTSSHVSTDKHTIVHPTFNARVLARLLMIFASRLLSVSHKSTGMMDHCLCG